IRKSLERKTFTILKSSNPLILTFSNSPETQILDLEELVDAVLRSFASDPRFLHAAERRDFGGDDAGIDADDPVFEGFRHAPDAADVTAVEVGRKAEFGIVRQPNGVGFSVEAEERRNRTKRLFARDGHRRRDVGQDGRFE